MPVWRCSSLRLMECSELLQELADMWPVVCLLLLGMPSSGMRVWSDVFLFQQSLGLRTSAISTRESVFDDICLFS